MRIGVDLLGSDSSPPILFQAVLQAASQFPHVSLVVFSDRESADEVFSRFSKVYPSRLHPTKGCHFSSSPIEFEIVKESIGMEDDPLLSIRTKKNSSLVCGIKSLKKHFIDAFVTAGNTGALIAASTFSLPLLPQIKRPALLATLPTEKENVVVIDVGGNVSCRAENLVQFAKLGSAYQKTFSRISKPRIGLLNIGVESKKGTSEVRKCYQMLQEMGAADEILFLGNIEGRDVFCGNVDVIVTDGFTGNVLLKTSEGVSSFILHKLKKIVKNLPEGDQNHILSELKKQFDPEGYPGAVVCGVDRVVVKCHGKSTEKGFFQGISAAIKLVQNGFLQQIKGHL